MAERLIPPILSVLLASNTLLFVAQQFKWFPQATFTENNDPFYLIFLILGVLAVGAVLYFMRSIRLRAILEKLLIIFFPAELILIFGLSQSKNFHYVFLMAIGAYILLAGMVAIHVYVTRETGDRPLLSHALRSVRPWVHTQGFHAITLVVLLTGVFFSFSAYHLTHFAAVDEPLWTDGRIPKYWKNIGERDWKGTRISDKPGITVALAAGPGTWFVNTKDFKAIRSAATLQSKGLDIQNLYLALRLPLLITITLCLPLFYILTERLLGRRSALLSYAMLTLSPVLIGISKIINPDSLLWLFVPLSLLAYLVFLKRQHYRYLILSGVLVGLALLTKYVANFVIVFMIGLIFLEWIYQEKTHALPIGNYLKKSLSDFAVLIFTALATFYVLFPAVWVKPEKLLTSTLYSQAFEKFAPVFIVLLILISIDLTWNRTRALAYLLGIFERARVWIGWTTAGFFILASLFVLVNSWLGMNWYDFMSLLSSPKTVSGRTDIFGIFLTNFYPLLFGLTPLVLVGVFVGAGSILRTDFFRHDSTRTALYLILFILLYYVGATGNGVAMIVRYQIILFPIAALLAALGLLWLLDRWQTRTLVQAHHFPILIALTVITGITTLVTTPFPLSYASRLLPSQFHTDVKDMGPGSYEAASWLNAQPDARELTIWTDKDGVCKFFVGTCRRGFGNYERFHAEGIDYIIVSSGRESRTGKMILGQVNSGV
ncbi:MAG: glycosyltransferase family 39 protein, partial [Candidatus Moraniibacteriota bacterium]